MRVLFSILLTILLITGIGGCDNCDLKRYVDINTMGVSVIHAGWQGDVTESFPVAYDSIVIQTSFSGTFYGNSSGSKSSGFLSSAIASEDCDHGQSGSKETIESITVTTLTHFDNEFKVNDNINSIIDASRYFSPGSSNAEFKSLSQYVAEIQPGINTDIYNNGGGLFLKLKKKPTENIIKLRVDVSLTNGEKYSAETIPVTIKQ